MKSQTSVTNTASRNMAIEHQVSIDSNQITRLTQDIGPKREEDSDYCFIKELIKFTRTTCRLRTKLELVLFSQSCYSKMVNSVRNDVARRY